MGDSARWREVARDLRQGMAIRPYLFTAHVGGLEVTQSIQYHQANRHLTDPADQGADNSVRLIAGKPAWVRAYVYSIFSDQIAGLTGTLQVERRSNGFYWASSTTLAPQPPGTVTARRVRDYVTQRSTLTDTLNFVIPADEFWGNLRLTVRLVSSSGAAHGSRTITVDATLQQTLRIRGIFVSYNGPATANPPPPPAPPPANISLAAPTLANLQATAGLALRAMPVQSQGQFASAGTVAWNLPLDDPRSCPGCCSVNWNLLLTALGNQRTNDGNRTDVVYYGLLPSGIPLGVPGCGFGGLGSAAVGDQQTLLHEIGHGYGFSHTPCGAGGTPDPNYPTYEPYASASIGEYGLDIATGAIMSPANTSDYMSYCGPQWMSLYQHQRLIFHSRLGQQWFRDDFAWQRYLKVRDYVIWRDLPYPPPDPYRWREMQFDPVIAISGLVDENGRVDVRSVARVAASGRPPGLRTDLTARLVGPEGETLGRGTLRRLNAQGHDCSCDDEGDPDDEPGVYAFEVYVPDKARGAALVIEDGEQRLWERRAPKSEPVVGTVDADVTHDARLRLRWDAQAQRDEQEGEQAWVQWSADDGASWRSLATGLSGREATLDLTGVPDGTVLFRVLVHDGFSTVVSEPARVEVPGRGPEVAILHPDDGAILLAGGSLRAWASVTDAAGTPIQDALCRWILDGREVGQGTDEWLVAPKPGDHKLTLLVHTPEGEVTRTVTFTCVPGPGLQYDLHC